MTVIKTGQILPPDPPGSRHLNFSLFIPCQPLQVDFMEDRAPAGMIDCNIDDNLRVPRVNTIHQLKKLFQGRDTGIKNRQCLIYICKAQGGIRASKSPHPSKRSWRRGDR